MKKTSVRDVIRVSAPPEKPLLIFDGDCGFCRRWIGRWRAVTGDRVDYIAARELAGRFPEIPVDRFKEAVQLVETDGTVLSAAEAVLAALARAPGKGWVRRLHARLPGFAFLANLSYKIVARTRA